MNARAFPEDDRVWLNESRKARLMLHALLILLVFLLILGWLVHHPWIALSLVLTVAGLLTWISAHKEIEAKEKAAAYVRELPQFCAQLREMSHWDEALVEGFNSDWKSVGRDEVAEKRAAYLRDLPRLCAQLREENKGDELLVEWANSDCKGVKS